MKKIVYSLLLAGMLMSCNKQDQMLNDYEKLIDKYEKIASKMADGDNSAITELGEIMEEGEELNKKIKEAKKNDEMSDEQKKRYNKLEARAIKIATDAMRKASKRNSEDVSFE